MSEASPARRLALGVLARVDVAGAYANLALDQAQRRAALAGRERAFATQLVYGTLRYLGQIDYVLAAVSSKPLAELDPGVRAALRLGLYQLLHLPQVPAATACDQSVELIKLRRPQAAGFVNGVLRSALRRLPTFAWPDPERDLAEALAVRESHPRWLVARWLDAYGAAATQAICRTNNQPAPTALRVNALKTTRTELAAELGAASDDLPGWSPAAIFMRGESRIDQLPAWREGRCSVQAASAQLAAPALDPEPGWIVYDLCSAPGGKATHLAERMNDRGRVVACELHPHKRRLIEQNIDRLGLRSLEVEIKDVLRLESVRQGTADGVLLDAPCLGTGVLRARADLRWRKSPDDLQALGALQRELLNAAADLLKPGGILLYATCSLEPEENEQNAAWLLSRRPDLVPEPLDGHVPEGALALGRRHGAHAITLLPHLTGSEGFFVARFRRTQRF